MKTKPKLGQVLYSLNVGNAARNREQVLTPVTVDKIGRKYFVCDGTEFHLDTWKQKSDFTPTEELYESEREWEDEKESCKIEKELRGVFGHYGKTGLTLDQLKRVKEIVDEK